MRQIHSVIVLVPLMAGIGFAQRAHSGGSGGHATPAAGGSGGRISSSGFAAARPSGGPYTRPTSPNPPPHQGGRGAPGHHYGGGPRGYVFPVIVGGYYGAPFYGYGYGYDSYGTPYDNTYYNDQQQQQPNVLYNPGYQQDYASPQIRNYDDVALPPPGPGYAPQAMQQRDPSPTIYLLALQDGTVLQALGYWVQGDTLCYIARDANPNRISMDRVDKELSTKLNIERGLEFKL